MLEIAATSLLLAELGPNALPPLYIVSAVALMLGGALLLPLIDRLDRGRFLAVLLAPAVIALFDRAVGSRIPRESIPGRVLNALAGGMVSLSPTRWVAPIQLTLQSRLSSTNGPFAIDRPTSTTSCPWS